MLTKEAGETIFDDSIIRVGGFLRARNGSWNEWRNGLITTMRRGIVQAIFCTGTHSTAYFSIRAQDVSAGLWELKYSSDLERIFATEDG